MISTNNLTPSAAKMIIRYDIFTSFYFFLLLSVNLPLSADSLIALDIRDRGQPYSQQAIVSTGKVRVEKAGGENIDLVFDSGNQTATMIDHNQRSYFVLDQTTVGKLEQAQTVMSQVQSQLQDQMANMSGEQREQLSQIMGDLGLGDMVQESSRATNTEQVIDSGQSRTINGINCRVYKTVNGQKVSSEICIATRLQLSLDQSDYNTLRSLANFAQQMLRKTAGLMATQGITLPAVAKLKVDGLPVYVNDADNQFLMSVRSIQPTSIDPDQFSIPTNYQRSELPSIGSLPSQ